MAFNVAANLLQPNWGETAGRNIRENMLRQQQQDQQNLLAQAIPAALTGDQNALAQVYAVDPNAGFRIQSSVTERKQTERKQRQDSIDGIEADLHGALVNAPDPAAAWPTLRAHAISRAQRLGYGADVTAALPEAYSPELMLEAKGGVGIKPAPPAGPTDDMREYAQAQQQGFKGTLQDWILGQKKAGATQVSVNTGQKGFENELKIRDDFRSEPTYKAFQEVDSAFKQINAGLDAKSPAGDLAAATKFMKILDPTSVVRESELGMAMAASGLPDRLFSYANKLVTGEKLSEAQREDFRNLAGEFYDKAAETYGAKRDEYHRIATDYGMNADRVTGPAPKSRSKPQGPVKINGDADYAQLPSGAEYIAPDGSHRRKK